MRNQSKKSSHSSEPPKKSGKNREEIPSENIFEMPRAEQSPGVETPDAGQAPRVEQSPGVETPDAEQASRVETPQKPPREKERENLYAVLIRKIREFKWTRENIWAKLRQGWAIFAAFVKKYGNIQTWKDSMIPEHPEYNERLKHFFVMVVGGVMACIFVLVMIFMLIAGISAPRVRMPDLVKKDVVEAVRLVQGEKLIANFDTQFDPELPRYTVIGQYPSAGLSVRQGRKVTIIVSMGQDTYLVPDLAGLNAAEAEELLKKEDIPYQLIVVPAGDSPVDTVIGQNFTANTRVPREKTFVITATQNVRSGEYRLDNFTRQNLDFALVRLLNNRLSPEIAATNVESIADDGMVLAQNVAPDTVVRPGSKVQLSVGVYARDQGERSRSKWGYIRYTFPLAENQGTQQITTNEEGSNIVVVTGSATTAKYFRMEVEDELMRRTTIYERTGGEGSTIIRAFKYYGNSRVIVTADGSIIETLEYK